MNSFEIIKTVRVTEKGTRQSEKYNQYTVVADRRATKTEIRQAVQERDDVGLAPGIRIGGIAGAHDVLLAALVENNVTIFRLQILAHIGIQEPAADELAAAARPLGVDLAADAGGDVGAFLPSPLLELGNTHDVAAFRARAARLARNRGRLESRVPILAEMIRRRLDRCAGTLCLSPLRLAHLDDSNS